MTLLVLDGVKLHWDLTGPLMILLTLGGIALVMYLLSRSNLRARKKPLLRNDRSGSPATDQQATKDRPGGDAAESKPHIGPNS